MAQIKYLDSRRIMGASGDTVETPTFEDDFTSYADQTAFNTAYPITTTQGGGGDRVKGNPTTNVIDAAVYGSDSSDNRSTVTYDLTSTSDTKWVLRTSITIVSSSTSSINYNNVQVGLSNNTVHTNNLMDFIGFTMEKSTSGSQYQITDTDNDYPANKQDATFTKTMVDGETIYVEIIRTSATTYTVNLYSDSGYSSLIESKSGTCTSTTDSLRYFRVSSLDNENGGSLVTTINDWKFWNGITSVTSKPKQPLSPSGCKAYYNFEQTSGSLTNIATTANGFDDGLGSSADGTNNGVTTGATGKVGSYAWDFTGASDYVTIGDTSTWKFLHDETTPYTISFWVKRSGTQANNEPALLDTQGATASNVGLCLYFDTSNNLYYFISDGTGTDSKSSSAITTSTTDFDHLVFVQDWTNLTIYKNGSSIQTIDMTSFSGSTGNSTFALNIGRNARVSSYANFYLDELAIFNRVLTANEVSALYNGGTGIAVNDSSLQIKPETNNIFVETDTALRYWFDGNHWNINPTYETDFSSNPTVSTADSNENYWDTTNNRWRTKWTWDNTSNAGSIDLYSKIGNQNLSDDNWTIRFKYTIVSQNFTTGSDSKQYFIGVTSHDYNTKFWYPYGSNVSTNFGLHFDKGGIYKFYTNNNSVYSAGTFTNFSKTISNETVYIEFIRQNGTTAKMNVYSDSSYQNLVESKTQTIASGLTGLRYLSVKGMEYSSVGVIDSNIDDLKIYNGISRVQQ